MVKEIANNMATMYYTPFQKDDAGEMPAPDAIENVLPDYKYIFYDPNRKAAGAPVEKKPQPESSQQQQQQRVKTPPPEPTRQEEEEEDSEEKRKRRERNTESLENTHMTLLDHQMKELDNYRQAVHKMGKDILTLRDHIQELEDENSSLRRQLHRYDETRKELMATSASDFDAIDKNELIVRYMTLKQRVQTQSTENTELKDKIQKQQVEIIKYNDRAEKFREVKQAHMQQAQHMQRLQEKVGKVARLEKACLHQEKVIENMEKVLKSKKFNVDDASKALNEENQRLRNELQQQRSQGPSETEKVRLYEQLEKAESRVTTLERTLADNSRLWARERQDLQTRLREAEHGFARTQNMVLHDYPSDNYRPTQSFDPAANTRRYGSPKLEPIRRL